MASAPGHPDVTAVDDALRTRRRVLGVGLGALAAAAASVLGRAAPARAADGDAVKVGQVNTGTGPTTIKNPNHYAIIGEGALGMLALGDEVGVIAQADDGYGVWGTDYGGSGAGVRGDGGISGVFGRVTRGWIRPPSLGAVYSAIPAGVLGRNTKGFGVVGVTGAHPDDPDSGNDKGSAGVLGASGRGKVGVYGASGAEIPVIGPVNCGVYGWSDPDAVPGYGVFGRMNGATGFGVLGTSDKGVGVRAATKTGKALTAEGRVDFSTSGLTTVPAGASSVLINPGVEIPDNARILCTLESLQQGLSVERTQKLPGQFGTPDQFRVFLSGTAANLRKPTRVAWFLIG